jgi:hypothetical protein
MPPNRPRPSSPASRPCCSWCAHSAGCLDPGCTCHRQTAIDRAEVATYLVEESREHGVVTLGFAIANFTDCLAEALAGAHRSVS